MTFKYYYENPYLKETEANILEKKFKDNRYYLKLDRTIFYPHMSGGQPRDKGTINQIEVLDVFEDGDGIIHVVDKDIKNNRILLSIDWNNRFDLMQQHTGQHLLSSCFYSLFNANTIGFHIGKEYTYIDITRSQITGDEIRKAEFLANKIIQSNFRVLSYMINRKELKEPLDFHIPKNQEEIRVIEIDGLDYTPCCGTHVYHTGEIGLIKILNWKKHKENTRIIFLCGSRALQDYHWKSLYIEDMAQFLSSNPKDILNKIKGFSLEKESLEKENKELRKELYMYKGESYFNDGKIQDGIRYIIKELKDVSIKEIGSIASYLNHKDKLIQIYVLTNEPSSQFLVSRSNDLDLDLQKIFNHISQKIIVKGGGNSQTIQGSSSPVLLDTMLKMFYSEIKRHLKG